MVRSGVGFWVIWFATAACIGVLVPAGGCCGDPQCEPPLSHERTPVADACLPDAWTRGDLRSFRVVVATGPYRLSEFAVAHLRNVMSEQAGLEVEIVEGTDTGLPGSGVLNDEDVISAGRAQIPPGDDAALVIVVVGDTTFPDATYGFIDWERGSRPTAVVGLHRAPAARITVGVISLEVIEAVIVVHEVGHWLGVPARDFHVSFLDGSHCTNARCVMFKGSRVGPCAVLANLCTGVPMRYCSDCEAELAEMRRRREANRIWLP